MEPDKLLVCMANPLNWGGRRHERKGKNLKHPKKGEKRDKAKDKKKKISKVERLNNEIAGLRAAVAIRDNKIEKLLADPKGYLRKEITNLKAELAQAASVNASLKSSLNTESTEDTEDGRGGSPTRPENTEDSRGGWACPSSAGRPNKGTPTRPGDKIQTENTMLPTCPWCGHIHPFPADHKHDRGYNCFSCGKPYFAEVKTAPRDDRFGTDYFWTTEKAVEK